MFLDGDIETSAKMAALVQHITQVRKPDSYASYLIVLSLKWHEADKAISTDFSGNEKTETTSETEIRC